MISHGTEWQSDWQSGWSGRIRLGFNARLFPGDWRPARDEVAFAATTGFTTLQFPGPELGLDAERLGCSLQQAGEALRQARLAAVMEIVVRVTEQGVTTSGQTPLNVLKANLPAISALACERVHWHLVPTFSSDSLYDFAAFEKRLVPQFLRAVEVAGETGFVFGLEHNEPDLGLFGTPDAVASMLSTVSDLQFVWDLNHTSPEHLPDFLELAPRMSMLHISDTPLPEVNHHLPVGRGSIDFPSYFGELARRGFSGPGILEIGGLPKSGGYGKDTDAALVESKRLIEVALRVIPDNTKNTSTGKIAYWQILA